MEPSDLKSHPNEDDLLASLLQERLPALPDGGFSRNVLNALPHAGRPTSVLCGLYFVGASVGLAVALFKGASWSELSSSAAQISELFARNVDRFMDPWLGGALALCGLSLLAMFVVNRQQQRRP